MSFYTLIKKKQQTGLSYCNRILYRSTQKILYNGHPFNILQFIMEVFGISVLSECCIMPYSYLLLPESHSEGQSLIILTYQSLRQYGALPLVFDVHFQVTLNLMEEIGQDRTSVLGKIFNHVCIGEHQLQIDLVTHSYRSQG